MQTDAPELPQPDHTVDASGLKCPLPILRAKKALAGMESGQILRVITTDPHAGADFDAFCKQTGNPLLAQHQTNHADHLEHFLQRR